MVYLIFQLNLHVQIYYKGSPEAKLSEGMAKFLPYSYKPLETIELPISKIKHKISGEDFKAYLVKQKAKLPGLIKARSSNISEKITWVCLFLVV
jgi:hypothetical protein